MSATGKPDRPPGGQRLSGDPKGPRGQRLSGHVATPPRLAANYVVDS